MNNLGFFIGLSLLFLLLNTPSVFVIPNGYYFYFRKILIIFTNGSSVAIENRIDGLYQALKPIERVGNSFFPRNECPDAGNGWCKCSMVEQLTRKNPLM